MPGEDGNCIFAGIICICGPVSFCSCLFDHVVSGATSVFGNTRLEANVVILRLRECNQASQRYKSFKTTTRDGRGALLTGAVADVSDHDKY